MVIIYFSGTGNSKYIAQLFANKMNIKSYSIEENVNFADVFKSNSTIGFCFPTYGSIVPRIMREFVEKHMSLLNGKKIFIFCTQLMFSGDGARAFTDLLHDVKVKVIYAEHFNMPNNICNTNIFKITNGEENKKYLINAERKMNVVCKNIRYGKVVKRGFNTFSKWLGLIQGSSFPKIEQKNLGSVKVNKDCISCGVCVKLCPMKNLELNGDTVVHKENCTLCYRCVNACPKKAINVLFHNEIKKQYKGITALK